MNHLDGKTPIRFALVGLGRIGLAHLEALAGVREAQLTAAVEPRATAGQAVSELHRVRWFADHGDPAILELADAVILCTPPSLHFEQARYFLERGRHVLCEKPLTLRSDEARQLVALARERGALLMMASKFRYVDDVVKAKSIVESGILGSIVLFENSFCGKVAMKDRWNSKRELAGGGVLIDNGTHSVDLARYLLGPITEVQAQHGIFAQGLEVEDTCRLQFRTQGGVMGAIDLSWSINKDSDGYVSVYGSEGSLVIGWKGSRYRQDGSAKWVSFGAGYDKTVALRRQIENFVATLQGREVPLITGEDALASVETIEAGYRSAGQNHWQPVAAAKVEGAGRQP